MNTSQAIDWLYSHRRLIPETGCWEYIADTTSDGKYGRVSSNSVVAKWSGETLVHRISAKVFKGWQQGPARHEQWEWSCGNTLCFNYEHLRRRLAQGGYRFCGRCKEEKPLSEHYFPRNRRDEAGFHKWCKSCWAAYYREHRDTWRRCNERFHAAHPEIKRLYARQRDARKKAGARGNVSFKRILIRDDWTCHICGNRVLSLDDLHFDHIVPLAKGGEHSEDNVAVAHAKCNMQKYTSLVPSKLLQLNLVIAS